MDIKIQVDFNNQNENGCVSLKTRGVEKSLEVIQLHVGDQITLIDGELSVQAVVVKSDGVFLVQPIGCGSCGYWMQDESADRRGGVCKCRVSDAFGCTTDAVEATCRHHTCLRKV